MQNIGIAGDCSEAALAPNRPSRRTEAVKQDTRKKQVIFIKSFQVTEEEKYLCKLIQNEIQTIWL